MTLVLDIAAVRPLGDVLGGEVVGGRLPVDLDSAGAEAIRAALDRHGLLLFRDQQLTPSELVDLTHRFGEPERFPESRAVKKRPEVCIVTNDPRQAPAQPVYWHTDGVQQPEPPSLSFFYAVRAPVSGGETLFADARTAYEELPEALRSAIRGRRAVLPSGLEQPLVRRHPRTGRLAVYVDFGRTVGITGLTRDRAAALLRDLRAGVARPEIVYSHRWAPGELAIWDNASVLHSATSPQSAEGLRIMWRTTVRGGPVIAA